MGIVDFLMELEEQRKVQLNQPQPQQTYLSLYDFLGKAAGKVLGEKVFKYAKYKKIKFTVKDVNQGGYSGNVVCYPREFLNEYFLVKKHWEETLKRWEQEKQYFI